MNKLLYLSDEELQSQLATKYNLLVHIGLESFQYAIVDALRDQIKVIAEFERPTDNSIISFLDAIKALPESSKEFKFTFNKVKISVDNSHQTLVPSDLYAGEALQQYSKYLKRTNTSELLVNNILCAEIHNVVEIESELIDALKLIFQKPRVYSTTTAFIEGIYKTRIPEQDLAIFIDVWKQHFQIGIMKDSKLAFHNSFEYLNADEFNYYILNVIESLGLQSFEGKVILSGKVSETDEIYQRIEKYFNKVQFADIDSLSKYPELFKEVPPHIYFSLISLDLCE